MYLTSSFYAVHIPAFEKASSEHTYTLDTNSRMQVENIMQRIYDENPSYWPEGLSVKGHEDLYMIRSASTDTPVGFTGWQTRNEAGKRVGYYTIGILPEYRQHGLAKEAVAKLISKKAAEVDAVRAYIAPHNKPSLKLADALNVPVVKSAGFKKSLPSLAGAAGNAAFWDWQNSEHQPWQGEYWQGMTKERAGMGLLNALLGAGGGHLIGKGMGFNGLKGTGGDVAAGATTVALSPAKDWLLQSLPAAHKLPKVMDQLSSGPSPTQRAIMYGAGGLGLAGLTYGGLRAMSAIKDLAETEKSRGGGRMSVTLPTKDPNDRETTIDIPFNEVGVSQLASNKLRRDLRRRINKEVAERTIKRKGTTSKRNDEDEEKSAALLMPAQNTSVSTLKALLQQIHG